MKKLLIIVIFCLCSFFILGQEMDKYNLYEILKNKKIENKQFKIKIDGDDELSYFSNENFVYYEEVLYTGDIDSKSEYYSPYVTEKYFFIIYKNRKYKVYYKDIRTYLKLTFEKIYTKSDADIPEGIKNELKDENEHVLINVYGLKKGKTYYALFHTDTYMVNSEEGIKGKENIVIWISDKPFKNGNPQVELTPNFQDWTY